MIFQQEYYCKKKAVYFVKNQPLQIGLKKITHPSPLAFLPFSRFYTSF